MRMKELSEASGVTVPTIKFYLREGLLKPGKATGPKQASYDESHLHRLRVIRALIGVAGLSVQASRAVLDIIEGPGDSVFEALRVVVALLPHGESATDPQGEHPNAERVMQQVEEAISPEPGEAVDTLKAALCAVEDSGLNITPGLIDGYLSATGLLARSELETLRLNDVSRAVEHAVLGIVLLEPVIVALHRVHRAALLSEYQLAEYQLAEQDGHRKREGSQRLLRQQDGTPPAPPTTPPTTH